MCADSTAAAPWEHTEREPPATATGTFLFIQNYSTQCDTSRFDRDGGGKLKCWHRIYKCNVTKCAPALPLNLKKTFASAVTESLFFAAALDALFNCFPIDPGALRSAKLISNIHIYLLTSSTSSVLIKGSSLSGMKTFFGGWASRNSKIFLPQPGKSDLTQRVRLFAKHQHWDLLRWN